MFRNLTGALVGLALAGMVTGAQATTVTYEFQFTGLGWEPLGSMGTSQDFFDLTGVNRTDSIAVRVTFHDSQSYPLQSYSGVEYSYEENYTPWTSFDLDFGGEVYSALPTDGNPYTSIRVRDGINDGTGNISDRVLMDAEFITLTPNGYEFTQALISLFSYDESAFSGLFVPTTDTLNQLGDGSRPLIIPVAYQGTVVQRLYATEFSVSQINPIPAPAALPLFATALAGMGFIGWRRRRRGRLTVRPVHPASYA